MLGTTEFIIFRVSANLRSMDSFHVTRGIYKKKIVKKKGYRGKHTFLRDQNPLSYQFFDADFFW